MSEILAIYEYTACCCIEYFCNLSEQKGFYMTETTCPCPFQFS